MAMFLSCLAGAILLVIYIIMCRKQRNVKGLFVKSFVSVCYLLTCAFAILSNPEHKELKEALQLNEDSIIICISTEGDTDKENYREIVWNGKYRNN